jgi:CemA family
MEGNNKFGRLWRQANQWFYRTADRALDEAYKAALKIKAIEDEHFGGDKIAIASEDNGSQVAAYFQNDLNKYLNIARIRLAEFQTSRTVTGTNYSRSPDGQQFDPGFNSINPYTQDIEQEARILEKLSFIDEILTRYAERTATDEYIEEIFGEPSTDDLVILRDGRSIALGRSDPGNLTERNSPPPVKKRRPENPLMNRSDPANDNISKKPIIDPSLLKTFERIQQDLNPQAEAQVIENYRYSQKKTRTSLRYLLILILVPLLVQYVSKIVLVGPAIDLYRSYRQADVFLNINLETEALAELEHFEKRLKFKQLVGLAPKLTTEQYEAQLVEKAEEIKVNFYRQSAEAIKNWFADIISILAFAWLIVTGKREIATIKSFIDEIVSGLSDTAKAFIIILVTDTFVGFHSPHGWEIILHGTALHLGIPENQAFNSLFIATFPVFIDTVFKYWIFRYLSGQSPSAVATFKTMNE